MPTSRRRLARLAFAAASVAALGSLAVPRRAAADDRDLLRTSSANPYVFIILVTSGSMNWAPPCSAADFAAGTCTPLCTSGDCFVSLMGDDTRSKIYEAKQALVSVLRQVNNVNFGFATYNQDQLYVAQKHWMYKATAAGVAIPGAPGGAWPAPNAQEVFGFEWACGSGSNVGCGPTTPADVTDFWQLTRMQRLPKGGSAFNQSQVFYILASNKTYKVTYTPVAGGVLGAPTVKTTVNVVRCTNSSCSSTTAVGTSTVTWSLVADFVSWEYQAVAGNPPDFEIGFYTQGNASDAAAANTCGTSSTNGWDSNTDTAADFESGLACNSANGACPLDIRSPTDATDPRGSFFTVGDVIPLDWTNDHNLLIQQRLAPALITNPLAIPDPSAANPAFAIAPYFNDQALSGDGFLRPKTAGVAPLIPNGSTPLAASLLAFRQWYAGCASGNCPSGGGWKGYAAAHDTSFACRRKYVLFITDGQETCGGNPCTVASDLNQRDGVTVDVIAFGVNAANSNISSINCMAANGGGVAYFPQNQAQLVAALETAFGSILEEATAFASAAVPQVQADISDKLFLTTFNPLQGESIWNGHLNAFLKPLPLTAGNQPDTSRVCNGTTVTSSCVLWDGGAAVVRAAPPPPGPSPTGSATELHLGPDWQLNRRVFYTEANATGAVPSTLRMFYAPTGPALPNNVDPLWTDLWNGLQIPYTVASPTAAHDRSVRILANQLKQRTDTLNFLNGSTQTITYTLGDTFHADPLVVSSPDSFSLYAANYKSNGAACGVGGSGLPTNPGYRCFADRHRQRRQMLFLAADDGQLHAFDIASYDAGSGAYLDDRKGLELFSYMPRLGLPIVRDQAEGTAQIFSLDGPPRAADVFIDPRYTTAPAATDDSNREWRTVLVGGFREGGSIFGGGQVNGFVSGYYALDVTQPDTLDSRNFPQSPGSPLSPTVPDCLDLNNQPVSANCGRNPFPAVLWEFTDSLSGSRFDEDGNSAPDLGASWSAPTLGRIKVTDSASGKVVDKWVAIFGGGFDPQSKTSPKSGTWLYIVDLETGQAIYKHTLVGAAAADPAVVDANQDGYLDTIYIGTTAGFLYKVDLSTPATLHPVTINKSLFLPALASNATVLRVDDRAWDPFAIFSTGGRPIYYAPTAFFLPAIGRFILGFGTGDRENLWNLTGQAGRFYMIEDEAFTRSTGGLPLTEANYQQIDSNGVDKAASSDFILNPPTGLNAGWVLLLNPDERLITQAFGLSGVVIFSSYNPQVVVTGSGSSVVCARSGDSRQFIVFANNGNSVLSTGGSPSRYLTIPEFVTNPFVEQGATKNAPATNKNSEQLDAIQQGIYNTLKKFAPKHARFANYWYSVSAVRSDTGYVREATIPISIVINNWKEH
jgi:Tfp pilus tip-associated adhesin PilY1